MTFQLLISLTGIPTFSSRFCACETGTKSARLCIYPTQASRARLPTTTIIYIQHRYIPGINPASQSLLPLTSAKSAHTHPPLSSPPLFRPAAAVTTTTLLLQLPFHAHPRSSHAILPCILQIPTFPYAGRFGQTTPLNTPELPILEPEPTTLSLSYDCYILERASSTAIHIRPWLPRLMGAASRWRTHASAWSWWDCPPGARAILHKRVNNSRLLHQFAQAPLLDSSPVIDTVCSRNIF